MPNASLLLVVDEIRSKELQGFLRNLGYRIADSLSDGELAITRAAEVRPDLVLISMRLGGGKEGIEIGSKIYSAHDIPIIYITERSGQATIQRSSGTAPFGYLFDPLDEKQILATIEVAITRHKMERRIRENERWLKAILTSIADGVIAIDKSGLVRFINPIAESLTGWGRLDAIGKSLYEVISLVDERTQQPVELSNFLNPLQDLEPRRGHQFILVNRQGSQIPVEIIVSFIGKPDEPIGMLLAIQDITERRLALQEIRRQAERAEAMLIVAAQLNTRLDVRNVLNTVCRIGNQTIKGTTTSAFIYDQQRNIFKDIAIIPNQNETRDQNIPLEVPSTLFDNMLSITNPVAVVEDIQSLDIPGIPYMDLIKKKNVRSLAFAGMFQYDTLIGVLVAQSAGSIRAFTSEELDLLRGLADQASIATANAALFEQIQSSRERTQMLARRLVEVQEEERRSLARELHDQIGQELTGLQFTINSLLPQASEEQKKIISEARKVLSDLIAQTREISVNLRPSMLDDVGILPTLDWHIDRYTSQTGIKVNFHHDFSDRRFTTDIETAIFRIVQEALTNIARYANVREADVSLELKDDAILIDIRDQGQGFTLDAIERKNPLGITGMRERAYALGGVLNIFSSIDKGTHVQAIIPLAGYVERRQYERNRLAGGRPPGGPPGNAQSPANGSRLFDRR